jgi:hypothetical protein
VDRAREVFGRFQLALNKCLVDGHLRRDVGEFILQSGLHLLSHGLEVALHPIDSNRDAFDERERLRVLCQHRRELARTMFPLAAFGSRNVTFAQGLFDWARTGNEDVHESPGALLPVRTGRHMGNADQRAEQIERLQISTNVAGLDGALYQRIIAPWI